MTYRTEEDVNHERRRANVQFHIMNALSKAEEAEEDITVQELCEALSAILNNLLVKQYTPTWKREEEK